MQQRDRTGGSRTALSYSPAFRSKGSGPAVSGPGGVRSLRAKRGADNRSPEERREGAKFKFHCFEVYPVQLVADGELCQNALITLRARTLEVSEEPPTLRHKDE
jgi:hypothetical protein